MYVYKTQNEEYYIHPHSTDGRPGKICSDRFVKGRVSGHTGCTAPSERVSQITLRRRRRWWRRRGSRSRRATIDHLLRHGNVYRVGREDCTAQIIRVYDTRTLYSHARVSCIRRACIYTAVVRTVLTRQRPDDDLLSLVKPLRCTSFYYYYYYYFPSLLLYFSYLHSLSSPLPVTSFIAIQRFPTSDPLRARVCVCVGMYISLSLYPHRTHQKRPLSCCGKSTLVSGVCIRICNISCGQLINYSWTYSGRGPMDKRYCHSSRSWAKFPNEG